MVPRPLVDRTVKPDELASFFAEPLIDMGEEEPAFAGIHAPRGSLGAERIGVTAQFLENAEQYHRA